MKTFAKFIIGLLIAIAGIYWYTVDKIYGINPLGSLKTVVIGSIGLCLIFFGILVAWIEYEDLKWEMEEKKSKRRKR